MANQWKGHELGKATLGTGRGPHDTSGLTSAPQAFTNVMAVVAAHLRRSEVPVFPYLND